MSTIEKDFDRLALLDDEGWTQNNDYHDFLLGHVPHGCVEALEIGCGTGAFSRRLARRAQHVTAIDLSSEMIRVARSRSTQLSNIDFEIADVMSRDLPTAHFDCIATIATLHHLPLREILLKMKAALKPGGVLLILDLFEPERNLVKPAGFFDSLIVNALAIPLSVGLRLIHHGRLLPSRAARDAWAAHERHDIYPTMDEVRALCAEILPGAKIKKHLLWRYSVVWRKS